MKVSHHVVPVRVVQLRKLARQEKKQRKVQHKQPATVGAKRPREEDEQQQAAAGGEGKKKSRPAAERPSVGLLAKATKGQDKVVVGSAKVGGGGGKQKASSGRSSSAAAKEKDPLIAKEEEEIRYLEKKLGLVGEPAACLLPCCGGKAGL